MWAQEDGTLGCRWCKGLAPLKCRKRHVSAEVAWPIVLYYKRMPNFSHFSSREIYFTDLLTFVLSFTIELGWVHMFALGGLVGWGLPVEKLALSLSLSPSFMIPQYLHFLFMKPRGLSSPGISISVEISIIGKLISACLLTFHACPVICPKVSWAYPK